LQQQNFKSDQYVSSEIALDALDVGSVLRTFSHSQQMTLDVMKLRIYQTSAIRRAHWPLTEIALVPQMSDRFEAAHARKLE
jgi:hypothetical protein